MNIIIYLNNKLMLSSEGAIKQIRVAEIIVTINSTDVHTWKFMQKYCNLCSVILYKEKFGRAKSEYMFLIANNRTFSCVIAAKLPSVISFLIQGIQATHDEMQVLLSLLI